jgi:hypothetical protein
MQGWFEVGIYFFGFIAGVVLSLVFIEDLYAKKYYSFLTEQRKKELMQWATEDRHICGDCGEILQSLRPGKYQCPNPFCPPKMREVQEFNDGE